MRDKHQLLKDVDGDIYKVEINVLKPLAVVFMLLEVMKHSNEC